MMTRSCCHGDYAVLRTCRLCFRGGNRIFRQEIVAGFCGVKSLGSFLHLGKQTVVTTRKSFQRRVHNMPLVSPHRIVLLLLLLLLFIYYYYYYYYYTVVTYDYLRYDFVETDLDVLFHRDLA